VSAHRREPERRLRPRVRRIGAAALSTVITSVALLGAVGIIPLGGAGTAATKSLASNVADHVVGAGATQVPTGTPSTKTGTTKQSTSKSSAKSSTKKTSTIKSSALPSASGTGRRVVFSKSAQRVWLVNAKGAPVATYLVSGSLTDNLTLGAYNVYSRSRWAVGIQDTGVMQYFVRFAHGANAAIGFHSIPSKNGTPLQKLSQLGTPQSHGCIRQKLSDAERMWNFAKNGTAVVVTA